MPEIKGPQGTGSRFQKLYAKLKAKYPTWSDIKIRRICSGLANVSGRK